MVRIICDEAYSFESNNFHFCTELDYRGPANDIWGTPLLDFKVSKDLYNSEISRVFYKVSNIIEEMTGTYIGNMRCNARLIACLVSPWDAYSVCDEILDNRGTVIERFLEKFIKLRFGEIPHVYTKGLFTQVQVGSLMNIMASIVGNMKEELRHDFNCFFLHYMRNGKVERIDS